MSWQVNWWTGKTGCYPLPLHARCVHCKDPLTKRSGSWDYPDGVRRTRGWFMWGVGPLCLWDTLAVWKDPDFFKRSGSNEYHQQHWDLESALRPQLPSIEEELKKL